MEVKITKLEHASEIQMLDVGYWVQGFLLRDIEVGRSIVLDRHNRNGTEIKGVFNTSPVKSITRQGNLLLIDTENSKYQVEFV